MKRAILSIGLLALTTQCFTQTTVREEIITKEGVPDVIIKAVEADFPGYVADEFTALPIEFVENDVIVDRNMDTMADYDTYAISLSGKGRQITANYDRSGNLLSTIEHLKNATPPAVVRNAIVKTYPGWTLASDTYNMTHFGHGSPRERYRIELSKGDEKMHIFTDASGKILNNPRIKHHAME